MLLWRKEESYCVVSRGTSGSFARVRLPLGLCSRVADGRVFVTVYLLTGYLPFALIGRVLVVSVNVSVTLHSPTSGIIFLGLPDFRSRHIIFGIIRETFVTLTQPPPEDGLLSC